MFATPMSSSRNGAQEIREEHQYQARLYAESDQFSMRQVHNATRSCRAAWLTSTRPGARRRELGRPTATCQLDRSWQTTRQTSQPSMVMLAGQGTGAIYNRSRPAQRRHKSVSTAAALSMDEDASRQVLRVPDPPQLQVELATTLPRSKSALACRIRRERGRGSAVARTTATYRGPERVHGRARPESAPKQAGSATQRCIRRPGAQ